MLRLYVGWMWLGLLVASQCSARVVKFDLLFDGDLLTNQFAGQGVTLQNARVGTSVVCWNEFQLPLRCDFSVNGGPLSIGFSVPQPPVFANLTYRQAVTPKAFDASNAPLDLHSDADGAPPIPGPSTFVALDTGFAGLPIFCGKQ